MIFYLSFADRSFLGGVFTEAPTKEEAFLKCTRLGNNPGGEVLIVEPSKDLELPSNIKEHLDVLLSKAALQELFGPVRQISVKEVNAQRMEIPE